MNDISIIPVGSGSTGNSIYLEIGPYRLLVDMGIGYRKIRDALNLHERNIENIDAIFVTHGHSDHVKAAPAISNHTKCLIYGNDTVMYPIRMIDEKRRIILDTDNDIEVLPGLKVRMFSVPHDYVRTCGFTFTYENRKIGFVTDCGKMNEKIIEELTGSDVVVIECNHDIEMLRHGPYPIFLQDRILSKYGHLSNDDCADTVVKLYEHGTRNFLLAHISQNNNTPELAYQAVHELTKDFYISLYVCPPEGDDLLSY